MHIGLIGGYGPAATAQYYLRLTEAAEAAGLPLRLTMVHGDLKEALAIAAAGQTARLVAILAAHGEALRQAGADICVLSTLSFHAHLERLSKQTDIPFCSLSVALRRHAETEGLKRIGVIGSHFAMSKALMGRDGQIDCLVPGDPKERDALDQAYFAMAVSRHCSTAHRDLFASSAQSLIQQGAEAVLLGGTDFVIARKTWNIPFPFIDLIEVHVRAICRLMEGDEAND